MAKIAQTHAILGHMRLYGSITPLVAYERYGCLRLGARIYDLEREGYPIKHELVTENEKRFARYSLVNCDSNGQYTLI